MGFFTAGCLTLVAVIAQQTVYGYDGLRVSGTSIIDGKGYGFVMRGINHPHTWYKNDMYSAIPAIAATGANVVRLVLSNGDKWTRDDDASVQRLLDLCRENKIVAMLEVHDALGSNEEWRLNNTANYWVSLASVLKGREDYVIINVANEWYGTWGQAEAWASAYRSVLPGLRQAGLRHLLVVDAAGWGQDASSVSQKGRSIFDADPQRNTAMSIHMYDAAGGDANAVRNNIDNALAIGVPLIIGEFSNAHSGRAVDYWAIMAYCVQRSVGYIAWSWYGNDAETAHMNLAYGPSGPLTGLGWDIVESDNGIRRTAWSVSTWW